MSAASPSLASGDDSSDQQKPNNSAEPLIRLEADFDGAVRFGKRVLELYQDRVVVLENGATEFTIPLTDVRTAPERAGRRRRAP